jgi:hypothetical protein
MKKKQEQQLNSLKKQLKQELFEEFSLLFSKHPKLEKIGWSQMYFRGSSDSGYTFTMSIEDAYLNGKHYEDMEDEPELESAHVDVVEFLQKQSEDALFLCSDCVILL